jgi:hypothetical protein
MILILRLNHINHYLLFKGHSMNQIKDICYQCNKVQAYNTMPELNQLQFDIYCNECLNVINERVKNEAN